MARAISKLASGWWDYTTLDKEILEDAARLMSRDLQQLERPGFRVSIYDTIEEFYTAEALEYVLVDHRQLLDGVVHPHRAFRQA